MFYVLCFMFYVLCFMFYVVCLLVLGKFSNFFLQYKAAALQKNVPRMNTDVLPSYTQNIAQGQKNDSRINAVYIGPLHPALHRNDAWPAPPGVTSERRLEGLCIHFLISFSL